MYHMSKAVDKAGDKGTLSKFLMALEVLLSIFPKPQQQHKMLHHGYCPGVFIVQHKAFWASFSLDTLGEDTQCACSKAQRMFLVVSPQNQTLSFPLSNFFHSANMLAHVGTAICAATWWPGSGNWSELKITQQKKRLFLTQLSSPSPL